MDAEQHALAVVRRQHGAIAHRQARAAGMSDEQIERRARRGLWVRRMRGVYTLAGSPDTPEQRAWVAFVAVQPADGVLSFVTAAAFDRVLAPSPLPHVTVPPGASPRCPIAKVHRSTVPLIDRAHRDGLVITSASRTIVDLATVLDRPSLEGVVDDAFCRRLATAESTLAAAERVGQRQGNDLLRRVVDVWTPTIDPDSPAEVRLLRLLADLGLRGLVTQYEVRDAEGRFVARLDIADPAQRRGFEYDGARHHGPRAWQRDEARYARLAALGWSVDTVTKLDLRPGEPRLRELVTRWRTAS